VAWEDRRGDRQFADVYAARLGPTERCWIRRGLALGVGPGAQTAPAVAWDGRNFVAPGTRAASACPGPGQPAGAILDRRPRSCRDGISSSWASRPCAGRRRRAPRGGAARAPGARRRTLRGLRLAGRRRRTGTVLVRDRRHRPGARGAVGCNQQAAVVVWSGNRAPRTRCRCRCSTSAGPADADREPAILQPAEGDEWAGIGSDGSDFLIAWRNFDGQGRRTVVGQRVSAAGRTAPRTARSA
jgi:hypothetical protein